MTSIPTLPSDRQLADAVRTGSDAAWNELLGRHLGPVRSTLRSRRQRRELQAGLARLRASIESEHEIDEGDPAIRAFRPRAIATLSGGTYGPLRSGAGEVADRPPGSFDVDDDELLATAFGRLPEPWQTVLWHSRVEQMTAAEISPLVGRTTLDVAELLSTAERGLVDAFLIEYLSVGPLDAESERVVSLLGGHVRGTLSPTEQRVIDAHFAQVDRTSDPIDPTPSPSAAGSFAPPRPRHHGVADSRRLVATISAIEERLPAAIAPGVTGLSVDEHRKGLGTTGRSFGSATLFDVQSQRFRRGATVAAVAAIVLVLAGAAYLIRKPFENDDVVSDGPAPSSVAPDTTIDDPDTTIDDPDDPGPSTTTVDEPAPTTTGLELRPAPSGPRNVVEIVADDGVRAIGVARSADDLEVVASTPAPIYAGGSGTIDLTVTNTADNVTEASLELQLPSGIVFEALIDGDAACSDPVDDSPFCNVVVDPGATVDLSLRFGLQSSTVGVFVVEGALLVEPFEAAIVVTPDLVHTSVARGDVVMIGNSLMTCADDAAAALDIDCDRVRSGEGDIVNRWDVPMEFVGTAPQFGVENASAATLTLPEQAAVTAAFLYWSGDLDERRQSIPDDGSNAVVDLVSPDGTVTRIDATKLTLGDVDATQYLGTADITDVVRAGGAGEYLVGNVQSVEVQGSYAAWSMVVVYDDPTEVRRHRIITRPFDWIAPEPRFEYGVDLPVPVVAGGTAQLDVFALEGERGFIPESLLIGDELAGGESVFDSTIVGDRDPMYDNNLGVDIDAYDLVIDTPDGTLPIRATSEKDGIRLAVFALSVDLPT